MSDPFDPSKPLKLDGPLYSASVDAPVPDAVAMGGRFERNWPGGWTKLPDGTTPRIEVEYPRTPRLWVSVQFHHAGWLPIGWLGRLAAESADGSIRAVFFRTRAVEVTRRELGLDLETPDDERHPFKVWVTGPPPVVRAS